MSLKSARSISALLAFVSAGRLLGQSITSNSPSYGSPGDIVRIYGNGFYPGTLVVKFNGTQDPTAQATAADGSIVQAQVPGGATSGYITVQVNNGAIAFSPEQFTVIGSGPYISDFSPTSGSAGTRVTINGAHFDTGINSVRFNGTITRSTNVVSATYMWADAPAGVTTGPISVSGPLGSSTNSQLFFAPPVITGFSPASGRTGTNVVLTGTNFTGASVVQFGSLNASTFTVDSPNQITAKVPTNAITGIIRVLAPASFYPTSSNFVVQPTVYRFSPAFGPINTPVTVTGANFNVGTPTVKFNGVTAPQPTGISFSQLTVTAPSGATSGQITVTTTDGTATSGANFYLPASITSFSPTNSPPGSTVTVTGQNLLGASAVSFNGASANFIPPTNNTSLVATVPAAVSSGPISVTTPAGTTNSSRLFYAAPVINGFAPTHGLPGTNVIITGTNFLGASHVRFNGTNAPIVSLDNGHVTATVPVGATTGPITVVAPAGTNTSANNFVLDYTSDVAVSLADAPDPVTVGSNLVYTISIANHGPYNAPNVQLTNTLSGSVNLISADTTQGSLATNNNPIIGHFGAIAVGGSVTVTLTVVPQTVGVITNTAAVGADLADPALGNNSGTVTTTVLPLPLLSIRLLSANRVMLSWPVALTNYALEFKRVLSTTTPWSNVTTAVSISGNQKVVVETNTGAMSFYRLAQ